MEHTVTVTAVPGSSTPLIVEDGTTVAGAVAQAGLSTTGMRVAVNGVASTTLDAPVRHGDRITVAAQVKGN